MERLTYFKDGHWRLDFGGVQYQADFVDRLAAYEDSKLSPEDATNLHAILRLGDGMTLMCLRELAVADQEGRVVVLPCKVGGDMINRILPEYSFLMENVRLVITYHSRGREYNMALRTFVGAVETGKIVAAGKEAEKALAELEGKA